MVTATWTPAFGPMLGAWREVDISGRRRTDDVGLGVTLYLAFLSLYLGNFLGTVQVSHVCVGRPTPHGRSPGGGLAHAAEPFGAEDEF